MAMGHCKHGEFQLAKGCPQCIAERQAAQERADAEVNSPDNIAKRIKEAEERALALVPPEDEKVAPPVSIVKVKYLNSSGVPAKGHEYSYFTAEPLAVGDKVQVPVYNRVQAAIVTVVDVPESEIAAFRDKVKTIPAGSKLTDQGPSVQAVTLGGTIEDTGTALQPPLVSTAEPVQEEAESEAYGDPKPCPYVPALVCHKAECANCDHIPTEGETGSLAAGAQEAGAIVKEVNLFDQVPSALVTIETQVGKPWPELLQLYQEAASLHRVAKDRVISTNEDLKPATNDLAIIATCKKAMFARKTEIVEPFKAKLDLVNQAFGDLMFPVLEADRLTRGQVNDFGNEQRRKAAEAQRIEDEKLRLAKEEAALTGTGEHTQELGTAPSPPPVPERTRTDLGTLGGRANWKARVVDFKLLDDEYKLPDTQTLNAKARSSKGTAVIPGVEFYNDRSVTVRTRGN